MDNENLKPDWKAHGYTFGDVLSDVDDVEKKQHINCFQTDSFSRILMFVSEPYER